MHLTLLPCELTRWPPAAAYNLPMGMTVEEMYGMEFNPFQDQQTFITCGEAPSLPVLLLLSTCWSPLCVRTALARC